MSAQGSRLIDTRVFLVVMAFSLAIGLMSAFAPFLSTFLLRRVGLSVADLSVIAILTSGLEYLLSPVLFFVVLYITCGGPLLNRIASVLMSLVFGSLVGYLIGSSIGSLAVGLLLLGQPALVSLSVLFLWQHVANQTLLGFAILAFSDINLRWKSALPTDALLKTRPGGVTLLVAYYVIFALLDTAAMPFLAIYSSFYVTPGATLSLITLGVVFGLIIAGQLVIAAGLYYGKKWGWIIAVISSASSLVISGYALVGMIASGAVGVSAGTPMLTLTLAIYIAGLIFSLIVLLYLLRIDVRKFFGFVNPSGQVQDKPAAAEVA